MVKVTYDHKITIIGDSSVGKSSIINRLLFDLFNSHIDCTIGASFMAKVYNYENYNIKLMLWDCSGDIKYRSLLPLYYKNTSIVMIVFSLIENSSYESSKRLYKEIREIISKNTDSEKTKYYIIGNKDDLLEDKNLKNKIRDELKKEINNNDIKLFFTSAKSGYGVEEVFKEIADTAPRIVNYNNVIKLGIDNNNSNSNNSNNSNLCCY
jgi:small GTP-binding protein